MSGQTLVFKCSNYRNPIYTGQTVGAFSLKINDNEAPPNEVVTYPEFSFTAATMQPRVYTSTPTFEYAEGVVSAAVNPISI